MRAIASRNLAADKCDAEVPCSLKTAKQPLSSRTMSPRNTMRPLNSRTAFCNSLCFSWQSCMTWPKCTLRFAFRASDSTSSYSRTESSSHAFLPSSFFHSFSSAALAAGIWRALSMAIGVCTRAQNSSDTKPAGAKFSWCTVQFCFCFWEALASPLKLAPPHFYFCFCCFY